MQPSRKNGEEIPSKDTDAKWGHRTAKNIRFSKGGKRRSSKKWNTDGKASDRNDSKDELYFGCKVDVIADSNHGLPLFAATRPVNASDFTAMISDLGDCRTLYRTLSPRYFLGGKGYDSRKNILHVVSLGKAPVISMRLPPEDNETRKWLYDGIFDGDGRRTCICGMSMEYIETDPKYGHLFRCPLQSLSIEGNRPVHAALLPRTPGIARGQVDANSRPAAALLRGVEGRVQEAPNH